MKHTEEIYTNKDTIIIQNGAIFVNAFMSFKVEIRMIYNIRGNIVAQTIWYRSRVSHLYDMEGQEKLWKKTGLGQVGGLHILFLGAKFEM